jgi:hypothetical protein
MNVVEAISMPVFPPENVWDLYILFLFVPFLLRLLLLTRPFYKVTKQLVPHGKWFFKQIRELPIKGLGIVAFNEVMAFSIPVLLVLILRTFSGGLGWETWDETPIIGLAFLVFLTLLWLLFDIFRIFRVRRMLLAIQKQNISKLKKYADGAISVRRWLNRFSKKDETDSDKAKRAGTSVGKKVGKLMLLRRFTPAGLATAVATGAAVEVARIGAGKVTDMIDEKMQQEFDKLAESSTDKLVVLLLRDFVMGLAPLVALWLIPTLLP